MIEGSGTESMESGGVGVAVGYIYFLQGILPDLVDGGVLPIP